MSHYVYFIILLMTVMMAAIIWHFNVKAAQTGRRCYVAPADMKKAGIQPVDRPISETERQTRQLIGNEAYDRMTSVVDNILRRHSRDCSVTVRLTAGPDSAEAAKEFHRLLPGDPLTLRRASENDCDFINVYSRGLRIGRLMLGDAEVVSHVLASTVLTGCYVCEQRSYGDCDSMMMGIVVFHSDAEIYKARQGEADMAEPYKMTVEGPQRIVLYQN
ncbi:MAG: hypothetical protein K2H47_00850 [Muribaculaceae bacterium]|nr:hypothetical protein [Muribaculaceae bacterium]